MGISYIIIIRIGGYRMINDRNVLKILSSNILGDKVKHVISVFYMNEVKCNIDKLDAKELFSYINNDSLPLEVKQIIDNMITSYSDMEINVILEEYFKNYYNDDDIYKEYFPKRIKNEIVKKKYGKTSLELLENDDISIEEKKLMVDILMTRMAYATVFISKKISDDVKDYIINEKLGNLQDIFYILSCEFVEMNIKEKIIDKYLNLDNYLDFIAIGGNRISVSLKEKIYNDNRELASKAIWLVNKDNIVDILINQETPSFVNELVATRRDDIVKMIGHAPIYQYNSLLARISDQELAKEIIKKNRLKVELAIMDTTPIDFLDIINNPGIPDNFRNSMIKGKWLTFSLFIKSVPVEYLTSHLLVNNSIVSVDTKRDIIGVRRNSLIKYFRNMDVTSLFHRLLSFDYIDDLIDLVIDGAIDSDNIMAVLALCNVDLGMKILNRKKETILSMLEMCDTDSLFKSMMITRDNDIIKNRIAFICNDIYCDRINKLDEKDIYKYLDSEDVVEFIKILILYRLGLGNGQEAFYLLDLIGNYDSRFIINNFTKLRDFFTETGLDFKIFIQYASGSHKYYNWVYRLVEIIDREKDDFLRVVKYLEDNDYIDGYRDKASVYRVVGFIKLIEIFDDNRELLIEITNEGKILSDKEINDLNFIMRIPGKKDIISLDMVDEYRDNLYKEYRNVILNSNNLNELKRIYLDVLVGGMYDSLKKIGGTGTLKKLRISNNESNIIDKLTSQMIKCSEIIEYGVDTNDIEGIRRILKYYFCDHFDELDRIQNVFLGFDEDIRYLFEVDARVNLTSINDMKLYTRNMDMENKYGGMVYDLRDTNYILYAHVLSKSESIDNLVLGKADGRRNFISTSAISYLGEKYYYDNSKNILAIAEIPEGSFICSSLGNMNTNNKIRNNSFEVVGIENKQRGILETSVVGKSNSEILLYREGVKVNGIILPGGRDATDDEIRMHNDYNLPFIITQNIGTVIEGPREIFKGNKIDDTREIKNDDVVMIGKLHDLIFGTVRVNISSDLYTGREIAVFTDIHALYEPTLAVLEDIRRKGIHEIYSLGDNIGVGPNPKEVLDLFDEYGVISVAGNNEYYSTLGSKPFIYFNDERQANLEWTNSEIGIEGIEKLQMYPASKDILVGDKKIALCHFINDVRWDYRDHSTWSYQKNFTPCVNAVQFLYTNSKDAHNDILNVINNQNYSQEELKGYIDSYQKPLFNGKNILEYDAIIQGHVHFAYQDALSHTGIYTLRGLAIGYKNSKESEKACYYILREKKDGSFDIVRENVPFNRRSMIANTKSSKIPYKKRILEYIS